MNFKALFNPQGANPWYLVSSFLLNFLWTGASLVIAYYFLEKSAQDGGWLQLTVMVSVFVGSLISGLLIGRLAQDNRGPTYGLLGSLGSAGISLFFFATIGGIFGIMLAVIALAGGLNGGLLSLRKPVKK